jgi:cytochrome c biogenesis protein CcmG/thiol:disulfide interchange protein DsbE
MLSRPRPRVLVLNLPKRPTFVPTRESPGPLRYTFAAQVVKTGTSSKMPTPSTHDVALSPRRRSTGLVLAGLGILVVVAALGVLLSDNRAADSTTPTDYAAIPASVSYAAPALQLTDLGGTERSLDQYAGQVIVVNLWATWCPPCAAEMPNLQRFHERHAGEGFTVIAVNDGDPRQQVVEYVSARGLTFPIWLDPTYEATDRAFKTTNLPSSYVVDRNGIVRLVWFGAISEANLEKYVTPLIKE